MLHKESSSICSASLAPLNCQQPLDSFIARQQKTATPGSINPRDAISLGRDRAPRCSVMGKVPFHGHSDLFPAVDFPTVILPTSPGEGQRLESAEICSTRKYGVQVSSKPATALVPVKPHLLPQTNSTLSPAFLLQHTATVSKSHGA